MHIRWRSVRLATLGMMLALSVKSLVSPGYVHGNATEFRKAVEYIDNNAADNDLVLLCSHSHLDWPFRHYSEKLKMSAGLLEVDESASFEGYSDAHRLWFVWRTDRTDDCSQSQNFVSDQFVLAETSEKVARKLGLTVLEPR
jgi:hypothetical protein